MDDSDTWRVGAANVIAKTWRDPKYKRAAIHDPKGALAVAGMALPDDLNVKVLENTASLKQLVLPPADKMGDAAKAGAALMANTSAMPKGVVAQTHEDLETAHHFVLPIPPHTDGYGGPIKEDAAHAMASAVEAINVATTGNVAAVQNVTGATEGVVVAVGAAVLTRTSEGRAGPCHGCRRARPDCTPAPGGCRGACGPFWDSLDDQQATRPRGPRLENRRVPRPGRLPDLHGAGLR